MSYSTQEKVWMVTKCAAGNSYRQVSELFHISHPMLPKPHHAHVRSASDTGCVDYRRVGTYSNRQESTREIVTLATVSLNPRASCRDMARQTGISQRSVIRYLHKHKYKSYKEHLSQELRPGDRERRMEFACAMLELCEEDPNVVRNIIFTDNLLSVCMAPQTGRTFECGPKKILAMCTLPELSTRVESTCGLES